MLNRTNYLEPRSWPFGFQFARTQVVGQRTHEVQIAEIKDASVNVKVIAQNQFLAEFRWRGMISKKHQPSQHQQQPPPPKFVSVKTNHGSSLHVRQCSLICSDILLLGQWAVVTQLPTATDTSTLELGNGCVTSFIHSCKREEGKAKVNPHCISFFVWQTGCLEPQPGPFGTIGSFIHSSQYCLDSWESICHLFRHSAENLVLHEFKRGM